jgi:hypothetical protein
MLGPSKLPPGDRHDATQPVRARSDDERRLHRDARLEGELRRRARLLRGQIVLCGCEREEDQRQRQVQILRLRSG